jgi:hypothetical protein
MMMKMHGLGDGAYWLVTYTWFWCLYVIYMAIFIGFGSLIGLNMFRRNSLWLQVRACAGARGGALRGAAPSRCDPCPIARPPRSPPLTVLPALPAPPVNPDPRSSCTRCLATT